MLWFAQQQPAALAKTLAAGVTLLQAQHGNINFNSRAKPPALQAIKRMQ
jgi:hypothetical protein